MTKIKKKLQYPEITSYHFIQKNALRKLTQKDSFTGLHIAETSQENNDHKIPDIPNLLPQSFKKKEKYLIKTLYRHHYYTKKK